LSELYERAIREEIAYWPGVQVEFGKRSKHRQALIHYGGKTRFVIYPDSPSDGARGHLNCLANLRTELRALEAKRLERRPKKRKRAHKVIGHRMPRPPVWARQGEAAPVKGDPWTALEALTFAPAPRKGHLREALRRLGGSVRRMVARSLKAMRPPPPVAAIKER
jgi:hypothetical protein